ncbi:hypothetical protein DM01DRAFT_1334803 [Hesseltinella vesiculosa]|uniref:Glycoside hydrolase family 31 N-terminal domain-containing protein n=1 Tax=Hesseltinella vesiculosa TaxID=101127 RepID=A0A1X2GLC7_9FUNG|nr:hypothetical protein DM01DRAFT_1334803 [Hesseltinella vesiculosa]
MWSQALKAFGLAPMEEYIHPRLSVGDRVLTNPFSTGHFKIQMDPEALTLTVTTTDGRVVWQSIHNEPFLLSTVGDDDFGTNDHGQLTITENDTLPIRLQTITKIAYDTMDKQVVHVSGGLGIKLVQPTHMDYVISFKEISPQQLEMQIHIPHRDPTMQNHKRLILSYMAGKEEEFYGFGQHYGAVNHKGQKVPILVREQDQGRDTTSVSKLWSSTKHLVTGDALSTNCAMPFYMTSEHRGFSLLNCQYSSFDLQDPERVTVRVNALNLTARLIHGQSMFDLLTEHTSYAGRIPSLPAWLGHGAIVDLQGGPEKVRHIVEQLRYYRVPLAAITISDWSGSLSPVATEQQPNPTAPYPISHWSLEHSSSLYPDWPALVQQLTHHVTKPGDVKSAATLAVTADGDDDPNDDDDDDIVMADSQMPPVRLLVNVTPYLSATDDNGHAGAVHSKDQLQHHYYKQAVDQGYLVQQAASDQPYLVQGPAGEAYGLLDLTNEHARLWFKDILKSQLLDIGISGFLADYGYTLPMNSPTTPRIKLSATQWDATDYHNQYAEDWTRLHQELLAETGLDDHAVVFARAGYTRSPGHITSLWTGDQTVTWNTHDGIKSAVTAMLNAGLSGFASCHSEVGGYMTADSGLPGTKMIRGKELLMRWMELAAFTCVFRTTEGLIPRANAQVYDDEESLMHLAHTASIFMALEPYRRHLLHDAKTKGWPVLRHLIMYYPHDATVKQLTYQQFMVGSCLMVAPVLSPSTSFVKVYFPKDDRNLQWRHIWSGKTYESDGTYQAINAPLGQPPTFVMEPRDQEPGARALNDLVKFASAYYDRLQPQKQPVA